VTRWALRVDRSLAHRSAVRCSLALAVVLLTRRSSSAEGFATFFWFRMTTDSGVVYTFNENQLKTAAIVLPGAFVLQSWQCEREPVRLNNSGSGYIGQILCTSDRGAASSSVLCNSSKPDKDSSGFNLSVLADGKAVGLAFELACSTLASGKPSPVNARPPNGG
jgi:hypothetical protein